MRSPQRYEYQASNKNTQRSKQAELIGGGVFFSGFGTCVFRLLPVEQSLRIQLFESLGYGGQLLNVLEEHLLDGWSAQAGRRMVKGHIGAAISEFGLSVNGGNLRSWKEARQRKAAERDDNAGIDGGKLAV